MDEETEKYLLDMVSSRPQEMCKMCGACCRCAATTHTYDELLKLKNEGDTSAKDFLDIFEPYKSIEDAIAHEPTTAQNIINSLKKSGKYDEKTHVFYHCRYIKDDNKCGIYEKRPLVCRLSPFNPFAVFPPNCGFTSWLKIKKNEKEHQYNEQKQTLQALLELKEKVQDEQTLKKVEKCIKNARNIIEYYKKYFK